jgi:hypothetical protein
MARSFNGSTDIYCSTTDQPADVTLAIFASHNSTTSIAAAMEAGRHDANDVGDILYFRGDTGGDPVQYRFSDGALGAGAANHGSAYSANTRYHLAAVGFGSNSHSIFRDGAGKVTNTTTTLAQGNKGRISIGCAYYNSAAADRLTGDCAMAGFWSTYLTDDEIVSLAKGFPPRRVRPQALVFYAPLVRNVFDWRRANGFTDSGSGVADHPRSYGF